MLHIKADKELFDKWNYLSRQVWNLATMIQNDMLVSESDLEDWIADARMAREKLLILTKETEAHCQRHTTEIVYCQGREEEK